MILQFPPAPHRGGCLGPLCAQIVGDRHYRRHNRAWWIGRNLLKPVRRQVRNRLPEIVFRFRTFSRRNLPLSSTSSS
jgi:hypothetical protein